MPPIQSSTRRPSARRTCAPSAGPPSRSGQASGRPRWRPSACTARWYAAGESGVRRFASIAAPTSARAASRAPERRSARGAPGLRPMMPNPIDRPVECLGRRLRHRSARPGRYGPSPRWEGFIPTGQEPMTRKMADEGEVRRRSREEARDERERRLERREALSAAIPYLAVVKAPSVPRPLKRIGRTLKAATYNVHRWSGLNGARAPDAARAGFVISELDADVIALQEVLRPFEEPDPLERMADAMHLHLAFVTTRVHRRGEIGNAILSRWPITSVFTLDLSFSRMERRSAVAAQFQSEAGPLSGTARAGSRWIRSSAIRSSRARSCCSAT